jgi:tRNA threonylcarbamoyladenosine biosynthesis protein TsaE
MITSHSVDETIAIGERMAGECQRGTVLALHGELGAGKTALVKGLARGLGIPQEVTSPTFTLIHEYRGGRLPLYHVDLYRLESPDQAVAIGLEDYLPGDGVTVIEWPERLRDLLPANTWHMFLKVVDENTRTIRAA